MKAKCRKCSDTVEVTKPREYKTCKCGAIGLDYGDGYYFRVNGDPRDFDGEIEGLPKIHDGEINVQHFQSGKTITTYHSNTAMSAPVEVDNYWAEMAEHFETLAKLCKEKSKL